MTEAIILELISFGHICVYGVTAIIIFAIMRKSIKSLSISIKNFVSIDLICQKSSR